MGDTTKKLIDKRGETIKKETPEMLLAQSWGSSLDSKNSEGEIRDEFFIGVRYRSPCTQILSFCTLPGT